MTHMIIIRNKIIPSIFVIFLGTILFVSCDSGLTPQFSYKPLYLPIKFVLDHNGKVSIIGEASLATHIGVFSIGAKYNIESDDDSLFIIMRNKRTGFDNIYSVKSGGGKFSAVVNGKTNIQIVKNQVLIDVTDSSIERIEFKNISSQSLIVKNNNKPSSEDAPLWKKILFGPLVWRIIERL